VLAAQAQANLPHHDGEALMKRWLWGFALLAVAACSLVPEAASTPEAITLKNYGPAPELTNTVWLNTDQPLRLADLRGQVVLLDFWTFG
jgi:hypothetical protein